MLILTRKKGEKINVGDEIVVSVVEIRFDRVRIGIDAPKSIPVFRKEVVQKNEKSLASKAVRACYEVRLSNETFCIVWADSEKRAQKITEDMYPFDSVIAVNFMFYDQETSYVSYPFRVSK